MLSNPIKRILEVKPGSIILTKLPQADGYGKQRPAIVLKQMPGYGDFLVCGISSRLRESIADFDIVIAPDTNK